MITVHEITQGTADWHELRSGKYTGSNAHKLLKFGAIPYSQTETGSFKGNYHTKRGHLLEDQAIELYNSIRQVEVSRPGFVTNSKYPSCGYSPDGLLPDRIIEVKCFTEDGHMAIWNGEIPLSVLAQCHFGMFICEKRRCDLIIYNPDITTGPKYQYKIIELKASHAIQNNLRRILNNEQGVLI